MEQVLYAWARHSRVYHDAAGAGHRVACQVAITNPFKGPNPPPGRTRCRRCAAMADNVGVGR